MKFFTSLLLTSLLFASALAQGIAIGYPLPGAVFTPGQNITVEVEKPATLTGSIDVGISISFLPCPCTLSPSELLGGHQAMD